MARVRDLKPGDVVRLPGEPGEGMFITRCPHEAYPSLWLVVWLLPSSGPAPGWSFDALADGQEVGELEQQTDAQRQHNLINALGALRKPDTGR